MNWNIISDSAIEVQIGEYIKKVRLQQNMTQNEVADGANISRSTLSLLEHGKSGNLRTLIQVLRVLNQLHILEVFKFKEVVSPLALAKAEHSSRQRVRKTKTKKAENLSAKRKRNW